MDPIERKAFIYAGSELDGGTVNWNNGRVTYPKPS